MVCAVLWPMAIMAIICICAIRDALTSCDNFKWHSAVTAQWGQWGEWTQCTDTCSGGFQMRTRVCDQPAPAPGGQTCPGNNHDLQLCSSNACPVSSRHPHQVACGQMCPGNNHDLQLCSGNACPAITDNGTLVAFSVGSLINFMPNTHARIPMEVDIYNLGGYYNHSDDFFHAPVKGVYSLSFSGLAIEDKVGDMNLYTEIPGSVKVHVDRPYGYLPTTWGGSASASVILQMERGETASVWLLGRVNEGLQGTPHPYGPTTLFSGKLERQLE